MSQQGFRHIGEVVSVFESGEIEVSLRSSTACDGCHAKGSCTTIAGGDNIRVMRVEVEDIGEYSVGDGVEVGITYRVGLISVIAAYLIPLVVFIATVILSVHFGLEDGVAALMAFGVAAIYYGAFYVFRDRFERIVHFEVRKI